jgi:hypothetical protein
MNKNRYMVKRGITTSDPAYASGDQIATVLEIPTAFNDGVGIALDSISLLDKGDQKSALDILIFNDEPVVVSADNAAVDISSSELEKCVGMISLAGSDYKTIKAATNAVAVKSDLGIVLKNSRTLPNKMNSLWILVISRGTPDWTAGENLLLTLGLEAN